MTLVYLSGPVKSSRPPNPFLKLFLPFFFLGNCFSNLPCMLCLRTLLTGDKV